jgi:class 3 adenylate cyclase
MKLARSRAKYVKFCTGVSAARAMASTRRLAAILAADVAGYSRLMGADEEGTAAAREARAWAGGEPGFVDFGYSAANDA